jgi:prophage regulatory protein
MKKILRKKEVREITGLGDTTLWRLEKMGKFPARLRLGGGAVGWIADEVEGWIEEKAAERHEPAAAAG